MLFLLPLSFCNKYHLFHLLHNCKSDFEILTNTLVRFIATWTIELGRAQLQSARSSPDNERAYLDVCSSSLFDLAPPIISMTPTNKNIIPAPRAYGVY